MRTNIPYIDSAELSTIEQALEKISDENYLGEIAVGIILDIERPDASLEVGIAERFGTTLDTYGMPHATFSLGSAYGPERLKYESECSTKPGIYIAKFILGSDDVKADYLLPLAATGQHSKAVISKFNYCAVDHKTSTGKELTRLSRKPVGSVKIGENPYFKSNSKKSGAKSSDEADNKPIIDGKALALKAIHNGRLGGQKLT